MLQFRYGKLPLTSRSAMDVVNMLPGVTTANGNRQAVINGLPRGTINITLDGVNVQDNTLRTTDGFFAIVSPRLDAIEEVTVSTAAQGAGDAGQGAVQVKFVTRSGTNDFTGSGYYYAPATTALTAALASTTTSAGSARTPASRSTPRATAATATSARCRSCCVTRRG